MIFSQRFLQHIPRNVLTTKQNLVLVHCIAMIAIHLSTEGKEQEKRKKKVYRGQGGEQHLMLSGELLLKMHMFEQHEKKT